MKIITFLIAIAIVFSGCDNITGIQETQTDAKQVRSNDNFLFIHNYGYCNDTACVGESIILKEQKGEYNKCIVFSVTTGEAVYNGYNHASITLNYDLQNTYSVNFGNGQTQIFNNNGTFDINWKCNRTYEVIICYE